MVRAGLRFTLLTLFAAGAVGSATAQVSPLDIVGGLMVAAQAQAAREAWARLPGADRNCLQRALATRNSDIEGLARGGIGPDDGRLGPYVTATRGLDDIRQVADAAQAPEQSQVGCAQASKDTEAQACP
jgi:hypothetical protein